MKITIRFEDDSNNPFHIDTTLVKGDVNTVHDLVYVFEQAARAAGFYLGGVTAYGTDGEDISNSQDLSATFTPDKW